MNEGKGKNMNKKEKKGGKKKKEERPVGWRIHITHNTKRMWFQYT